MEKKPEFKQTTTEFIDAMKAGVLFFIEGTTLEIERAESGVWSVEFHIGVGDPITMLMRPIIEKKIVHAIALWCAAAELSVDPKITIKIKLTHAANGVATVVNSLDVDDIISSIPQEDPNQ